ncbi:hypothetical protein KAU18_08155 [Candidatus Bathyarchaeota archaeon]|nr:hypothetical protein [Candidatus Bathyarchaeota archaeon]
MSSPTPPKRWLRAFAFDPIISRKIETHEINEVTIGLPWEKNLRPGPVDDYLEVVDYDPSSKAFYAPVDLNDTNLLAQDGLPASEGSPQFHQQMVYAVARNTISHFERALGRRALWSLDKDYNFVERLRVYPHAFREANAYYSPYKKALLFGYFPASTSEAGDNLPGGTVFTCLSHDIVAHETTHALLDGLHPRFIEPTNVDVWALHEAFADIVALFQHFSYPEVLRHQIDLTRGFLERQNLLGELAMQFGQAIEHYGALRSAIGRIDEKTNKWVPLEPDPEKILTTREPHRRGAILVAAVFDAFLTIYKWRIADLLRIYTGGTGVLPAGQLHPDLVNRLAKEAAKTAKHMLNMCIRALDYCPPVDVDYGDYLRAMITADVEMVPDDSLNYRIAVIEAFRRRGIYPRDVRNLSEESLLWHKPTTEEQLAFQKVFTCPRKVRELVPDWGLTTSRKEIHDQAEECRRTLHGWFTDPIARDAAEASKIVLDKNIPKSIYRGDDGIPTLEVHSVRPARRIGPDGQAVTELVVEMTQRRWGYFDTCVQKKVDRGDMEQTDPDFIFRGGCTLLVDLETAKVRYCIFKRVTSENRLDRMRRYLLGDWRSSNRATYFGDPRLTYWQRATSKRREMRQMVEPFALLHRSYETQEEIR